MLRTLDPVNAPPVVQRHPALRWLAPLAVVGVAGVVATGMFRAQATSETLPDASPKALIVAVQKPQLTGFSGTVVSRLSLGLPKIPSLAGGESDDTSMASLLTGSHTLQVWYGGPDQQRIALLGATDETDVFRSGRQVWQWTSVTRVALHTVLPDRSGGDRTPQPSRTLTPAGLADDMLRDLDPTTKVTVNADHRVANRNAYELVLTPRTSETKVGSVHISVDGKTKVPLGVQVYARGARTPAIDFAYTSISFVKPADTYFRFTPPAGATVRNQDLPSHRGTGSSRARAAKTVSTSGTGWQTVWTYRSDSHTDRVPKGPLTEASKRVYGPWGAGRLFNSDLATVLVTDDGRVLAGAVEANTLFAAAK